MSDHDDLLQEFLVECHEGLDRLDEDFLALEEDPSSTAQLSSIFRTIHTIKGSCGFLDLSRLEAVTHAGENLLSALRDGHVAVDDEITSSLLRLVDAVREMLAHVESTGREGEADYSALVRELERLQDPEREPERPAASDAPDPAVADSADQRPSGDDLEAEVVRLGELLVATDEIEEPQIQRALERQAAGDERPLGEILGEEAGISPSKVSQALVRQQALGDTSSQERPGSSISGANVRVQVEQLDMLMNLAGELVLARNQILQSATTSQDASTIATAQRLNVITTELQERIMKVRMQPVGMLWSKYPRIVRDIAKQLGKSVRLDMRGKGTELDKTLLEAIKDPLTHIVRNAVDHGLESPEDRVAAGKDPEGTLSLAAYHESGQVFLEIADDGKGIDAEAVKAKAVANGQISAEEAAAMSDRQALQLVFQAGLSTARVVTNVSGRGVGMDVVKTNIEKIGGSIELSSRSGRGTTVLIKIPLTLAIIPALIVTAADDRYAVPQVSLVELVRLDGDAARTGIEDLRGTPVYRLRGDLLPLVYLDEQLALQRDEAPGDEDVCRNIVVVRAGERQFGLVVDDINDTEEIVVKPLGQQTKGVDAYAGTTILGDGRVALILDVLGLARRAGVVKEEGNDRPLDEQAPTEIGHGEITTYLLLGCAGESRLAIELADVDRLEEFSPEQIERSGGSTVVQYRGEIMPLVHVSERIGFAGTEASEGDGVVRVVVHSRDGHSIGLIVGEISDIVEVSEPVQRASNRAGLRSTVVVDGRVSDVLDLDALVAGEVPADGAGRGPLDAAAERVRQDGVRQFCTFRLGDLFLGVDVTEVQEVIRHQPMTRVPLAGSVVRGLINLRGQTVTALDVRARLGMPPCREATDDSDSDELPMNLVLRTAEGAVSILVDSVGDVLTVDESVRAPVPNTVLPDLREILSGIYKLEQGLLLHLDIERLVDLSDCGVA